MFTINMPLRICRGEVTLTGHHHWCFVNSFVTWSLCDAIIFPLLRFSLKCISGIFCFVRGDLMRRDRKDDIQQRFPATISLLTLHLHGQCPIWASKIFFFFFSFWNGVCLLLFVKQTNEKFQFVTVEKIYSQHPLLPTFDMSQEQLQMFTTHSQTVFHHFISSEYWVIY